MRKVYLASVALAAGSLIAVAPATAYDFNGLYFGIQAGYGWGNTEQAFGAIGGPYTVAPLEEADFDGFVGGAHLGFNFRASSNFLLGLEGDFEFSDEHGDDNGVGGDINGVNANWQASVRARAGYLLSPDVLLYATGGVVFLDADLVKDNAPVETDSLSFTGWTGGGGIEFAVSPNITARVEYRYSDYGDDEGGFPVAGYGEQVSPTANEVRIGFSFDL